MSNFVIVRETSKKDGYWFDYKETRVLIKKFSYEKNTIAKFREKDMTNEELEKSKYESSEIINYVGIAFSKGAKPSYSIPNPCLNSVVQEFIQIIDERS